jgi:hypothetical protein
MARDVILWHREKGIRKDKIARKGLGRNKPSDLSHLDKYALRDLPTAAPQGVPVVIGVNWYENFDTPEADASNPNMWWIGRGNLGGIRGGHCVCLKPGERPDPIRYYNFFDQGREGACVGFGTARAASLIERRLFNPWWMWDHAKMVDEWGDTNPGDDNGTSVHAAFDVWRTRGFARYARNQANMSVEERDALAPDSSFRLRENRWATSVDEVLTVLNMPRATKLGAVPMLNSWNGDFPHIAWIPGETLERLRQEDGEFGVPIL